MENKNNTYLHKWLNDELSEAEFEAFSKSEEYKENADIVNLFKGAKVPVFDEVTAYQELTKMKASQQNKQKEKVFQLNRKWMSMAASLVLLITIGYLSFQWLTNEMEHYETAHGEIEQLVLPDNSTVALNMQSSISYNAETWKKSRGLLLDGEAYFKVAKGKTFKVNTSLGIVEVLGTQFNVKQRNHQFEVVCYEGKVQVTHQNKQYILTAGDYFSFVNGHIQFESKKIQNVKPDWLEKRSYFNGVPLYIIFKDIELYYDIQIVTKNNIDNQQLFSGGYKHSENLKNVLKSICEPFGLSYTIKKDTVYIE